MLANNWTIHCNHFSSRCFFSALALWWWWLFKWKTHSLTAAHGLIYRSIAFCILLFLSFLLFIFPLFFFFIFTALLAMCECFVLLFIVIICAFSLPLLLVCGNLVLNAFISLISYLLRFFSATLMVANNYNCFSSLITLLVEYCIECMLFILMH